MNPLSSPKIFEIAVGIGLTDSLSPSTCIIQYCEQKVRNFLSLLPDCSTPQALLGIAAGMLRARFECVESDADLDSMIKRYCNRGETGFANLVRDLGPATYGVTVRLRLAAPHEPQFICVIDCRGHKALRSYFTKWHELGHLLILTDEQRSTYYRNHDSAGNKEPEEILVDILAGHFGFFPEFLKPELTQPLSIAEVNRIRSMLFPEASFYASANACVKNHADPCMLIEAKIAFSEKQKGAQDQGSFEFFIGPEPKLRAITVIRNDAARKQKFNIPQNFRVPQRSIIYQVHRNGVDRLAALEDLAWWESSDSRQLPSMTVHVEARKSFDGVLALMRPA